MGISCNHGHEEEIKEDTICCTRRRGRYARVSGMNQNQRERREEKIDPVSCCT